MENSLHPSAQGQLLEENQKGKLLLDNPFKITKYAHTFNRLSLNA
jgi:hypothetical protein